MPYSRYSIDLSNRVLFDKSSLLGSFRIEPVTFFLPTILARVGAAPIALRASEGDPGVILTLIMSRVSASNGYDSCTWLARRLIWLISVRSGMVSRLQIDW